MIFCPDGIIPDSGLTGLNNTYIYTYIYIYIYSQVGWSCRIHQRHFSQGKIPPSNECPGYDIKRSDGEAATLELWEIWSIPSLPLFPPLLWLGAAAAGLNNTYICVRVYIYVCVCVCVLYISLRNKKINEYIRLWIYFIHSLGSSDVIHIWRIHERAN